MDIFGFRDGVIGDYRAFVEGFLEIRDPRLKEHVRRTLSSGALWPDPLLQLNPSFEPGRSIDQLVADGVLERPCREIFRKDKDSIPGGKPMHLHWHQEQAVLRARTGKPYVLTTGTGSGKSLAYILPIVNHVLAQGTGKGIRAVIVYPLNALANSQEAELKGYLQAGFGDGKQPVSFARYTGDLGEAERRALHDHPPDIILTNYVMLEYILTRPEDRALVEAMKSLRFLVLDELHTYRGRQGADVALLVRRLRDAAGVPGLQVVGTSATMAEGGTSEDRRRRVAEVAGNLFGAPLDAEGVIGERLRPSLEPLAADCAPALAQRIRQGAEPDSLAGLRADLLARWLEDRAGLEREEGTGLLLRARPRSIDGPDGLGALLAAETGLPQEACARALRGLLRAAAEVAAAHSGERPPLAFRLHQFISKGDHLYATLEDPEKRDITLEYQTRAPRRDDNALLLPLAFCRCCGQDYVVASREPVRGQADRHQLVRRDLRDLSDDDGREPGYLVLGEVARTFPIDDEQKLLEMLPDDWLEADGLGGTSLLAGNRNRLPQVVFVGVDGVGHGAPGEGRVQALWLPAPFRMCVACTIGYDANQRKEITKLSPIGNEGRATATTMLAMSAVTRLRANSAVPAAARKLMSFTDNRQDASLQAGHFNDFVEVGLLRGAMARAVVAAGPEGLASKDLETAVFRAMAMPREAYAANPDAAYGAGARAADDAMRGVVGYRLHQDMARGLRLTQPNLEQCGLVVVEYDGLAEACADAGLWNGAPAPLAEAAPGARLTVCRTLFDELRRTLAVESLSLDEDALATLANASHFHLRAPWALEKDELKGKGALIALPRKRLGKNERRHGRVHFGPRGSFGKFITRPALLGREGRLNDDERAEVITALFERLAKAGFLRRHENYQTGPKTKETAYRLNGGCVVWKAGDGRMVAPDVLRMPTREKRAGLPANPFFVDHYTRTAPALRDLSAREHTAQVDDEDRNIREEEFRAGNLQVLFCSPTMELGIDISDLMAVHMRNVPPTPANYAQRSGRAGRSGQAALVLTYCAHGSPHDQHYFQNPARMVRGVVSPPRLDLLNEDLVRAHMHSVWLACAGAKLSASVHENLVKDTAGTYPLRPDLLARLRESSVRAEARSRCEGILKSIAGVADCGWHTPGWLGMVLDQALEHLDRAFDNWRVQYTSARQAMSHYQGRMMDNTAREEDRQQARDLRDDAEARMFDLEGASRGANSDTYVYRYLASQGFLPGYNFPRLPITARLKVREGKNRDLQRPRFLAISEFGPRALIYHEGARHEIVSVVIERSATGEGGVRFNKAKICPGCSTLHEQAEAVDVCVACKAKLGPPMDNFLRMLNVTTRRRERIHSDEEERMRLGYEVRTAVAFDGGPGGQLLAHLGDGETPAWTLRYGRAATLWRINKGWKRRDAHAPEGFPLDLDNGKWLTQSQYQDDGDSEKPDAVNKRIVIPFVEDMRNALVLSPAVRPDREAMLSLAAALKQAVQRVFQLEDNELACECLPGDDHPAHILLYEAAEGGAGALRRVLDEPGRLAELARVAREVCHHDPHTGADLAGPQSAEPCARACYRCLLHYGNQPLHDTLDRRLVLAPLAPMVELPLRLATAGHASQAAQLEHLEKGCGSELERDWLRACHAGGYHLPDTNQKNIDGIFVKPDFIYANDGKKTVVFIDGPHHDAPAQAADDARKREALELKGWLVLVFRYDDKAGWASRLAENPGTFGKGS